MEIEVEQDNSTLNYSITEVNQLQSARRTTFGSPHLPGVHNLWLAAPTFGFSLGKSESLFVFDTVSNFREMYVENFAMNFDSFIIDAIGYAGL